MINEIIADPILFLFVNAGLSVAILVLFAAGAILLNYLMLFFQKVFVTYAFAVYIAHNIRYKNMTNGRIFKDSEGTRWQMKPIKEP